MNPELIHHLDELTPHQGFNTTQLEGVMLYRSETPINRATLMYDPCVVVVAQRHKIGYLGAKTFVYDSGHYLVVPALLPFECDAEGSKDKPYLALSIPLKVETVAEVMSKMKMPDASSELDNDLIYAEAVSDEIESASVRLLRCLRDPTESKILGNQIVREMIYWVLKGPKARILFDIYSSPSKHQRVARSLRYIHENLESKIDVESLARMEGMSLSLYHQQFKKVTSSPPLQYIKRVRLNRARDLITFGGLTASAAAYKVGYQSVSQFSREFKQYFGYKSKDSSLHYPIQTIS